MKSLKSIPLLLLLNLFLTNCTISRNKNMVAECEERQELTGKISNILLETGTAENVKIHGSVTENRKQVKGGLIHFTNEATGVTVSEFIVNDFSVSLQPGTYQVKIDADLYSNYDLGVLEFKPGEVRRIDFVLDGRVLFIARQVVSKESNPGTK